MDEMNNYNNGNKSGLGFGVTSLVLGLVSILCSCCFYYIALPCSILGVIFGAVSIKKSTQGKGMGIAGLILSIISLVPAIIAIAMGSAIYSSLNL